MPASNPTKRPTVLLFDIGGVCVVSPFQAILDYERSKGIPEGWVNYSISQSGPSGAWSQLERGEVSLDAAFFRHFKADLTDEKRWARYYPQSLARQNGSNANAAVDRPLPPVPDIEAEWLYWEMMRVSRQMDPHMYPALQKLRKAADQSGSGIILAALSNTSIFPPDHPYNDRTTPEYKQHLQLTALFDIFISSAHVGMRKPHDDIYIYTIRQLNDVAANKGYGRVEAGDITFLDDIGQNLRTARRLGMRTIKVVLGKSDVAVKELQDFTGLDLSTDRAKL